MSLLEQEHPRWLEETVLPSSSSAATTDDDNEGNDLAASIVSSTFLFLLIFGLSATVDIRHLKHELRNKFALITGLVMQFLIMPLLGFLSVLALRNQGLTQAMGVTLLVVTASPGGSYSNWWCSTFNADLALSVAMTAVSTLLSIGLLPANLLLYTFLAYGVTEGEQGGIWHALDLRAIFVSLAIVICAILLGLYASYRMNESLVFHRWANRLGSISGICLILVSVFLSSSNDAETKFWSQPWTFYVGVALPCAIGLLLANVACRLFRLRKPEQVAISIECCYQNVGIATSVAVNMFDDPVERAQAVAVPLFYGIVEAILIGGYCVLSWKFGWTKAPKDEKLCVVVTRTYEIGHDREDDEDYEDLEENDNDEDDIDCDEEASIGQELPQRDHPSLSLQGASIPEEVHHLEGWRAWLAWPFVPRYPEQLVPATATTTRQGQEQQQQQQHQGLEDVELAGALTSSTTPKDHKMRKEDTDDQERSRFVSEDYTAATATSMVSTTTTDGNVSPPSTPGASSPVVADSPLESSIVSNRIRQYEELSLTTSTRTSTVTVVTTTPGSKVRNQQPSRLPDDLCLPKT